MIAPPRDPGPAAWNALLPKASPPTPLEEDRRADWVIIGAGFAGLTAARRLSQLCPTDRIVILEATRVAEGPAGRNSGFMIDLPHDLASENYGGSAEADRATIADNRRAMAFAREMVAAFDLPPEAFDESGKVNGAATTKGDSHNRAYAKHLGTLGEAHEWLDAHAMRDLTGTDYYRSGLYTPGTVILQPAMFVRGVAAGLVSNRVSLHENTPVTGLRREGDWVVETPQARVRAARVVLTVNGHLQSFGHAAGRLVHVHTYASMTRAMTDDEVARLGGASRWGITPSDPLGTTVRRVSGTGGDRIVVRNRFTYDPALFPAQDWEQRVARDQTRAFAARFPMLGGLEMEYRWGGRLCLSLNNVQVVEELEPGLFAGCCQNGLGTVRGTLAGMLVAEMACGVASDALTRAKASAVPRRLPPFAKLGARARLRWGEWRAGAEL